MRLIAILKQQAFAANLRRIYAVSSVVAMAMLVTGCQREEIQVYRVPKDPARWAVPSNWEELPASRMRLASFTVIGKTPEELEIAVVPLPGAPGSDLDFVNLWREQLKLTPISESQLATAIQPAAIGTATGKLFDLSAETVSEGRPEPTRLVVAHLLHDNVVWFFKMSGSKSVVEKELPAFTGFLKSVNLPLLNQRALQTMAKASAPHGDGAARGPSAPAEKVAKPTWAVPEGWQEQTASSMRIGSFLASGADGKADISVTQLGGPAGGALANVNRWRGQVGLPDFQQADLDKQAQSLELADGRAILVEMTGKDAQGKATSITAVILPQAGLTWFYKMMGDAPAVAREKAAFIKFVQSARHNGNG
jgi:hypothetical protein